MNTGIKSSAEILSEIAESGIDEAIESPKADKVKDLGTASVNEDATITLIYKDNEVTLLTGRFYKVSAGPSGRVGIAHLTADIDFDGNADLRYTDRSGNTRIITAREFLAQRKLGYVSLNARNSDKTLPASVSPAIEQAVEVIEELTEAEMELLNA